MSEEQKPEGESRVDLSYNRKVVMNGLEICGVQSLKVDLPGPNARKPITKVTMTFFIKKDSLKTDAEVIAFDTVDAIRPL